MVLGRTSNLPTVWSNCLAATLLARGGSAEHLVGIIVAGTLLYVGGMFLNDAFDADFDRQFRRERPIPSGAITEKEVWIWGSSFLALGLILSFRAGVTPGFFAVLLTAAILLYDAVHKAIEFSPVLMALCRLFLYLLAAAAAHSLAWGFAFWPALGLASYIIGLSFIARRETGRGAIQFWPAWLMLVPLLLALATNDGPARKATVVWGLLAVAWTIYSLKHTFWTTSRNVPRTVTGLLAGIILVDAMLVGPTQWKFHLAFAFLFLFCRLFQRFIPAT